MDINTARLLREVKKSCTYRRLSEIWNDEEGGDQMEGQDLCREACEALGIQWNNYYEDAGEKFKEDNKSYVGDFWWWD